METPLVCTIIYNNTDICKIILSQYGDSVDVIINIACNLLGINPVFEYILKEDDHVFDNKDIIARSITCNMYCKEDVYTKKEGIKKRLELRDVLREDMPGAVVARYGTTRYNPHTQCSCVDVEVTVNLQLHRIKAFLDLNYKHRFRIINKSGKHNVYIVRIVV